MSCARLQREVDNHQYIQMQGLQHQCLLKTPFSIRPPLQTCGRYGSISFVVFRLLQNSTLTGALLSSGPPQLALVPTLRKIWNSQSVSKQPLSSQSASSVKSAPPAVSNRSQSIPGNSLKETAFRRQAAAEV